MFDSFLISSRASVSKSLHAAKAFIPLPRLLLGGGIAALLALGIWVALTPRAYAAPSGSYSSGISAVDDTIIGLTADNDGPTEVNHPTSFSAAVTEGSGISYTWDFGDSNSGSGSTPTHIYTESGVYTATVVASNDTDSLTATTTIYVGDAVVEVLLNSTYSPANVTIPEGGKVVWVLRGGEHSVTANDGSFEQPAGTVWPPFIHTFNSAGTVDYHCIVHGFSMAGSVVVQGSSSQPDLLLPNIRK